MECRLAKRLAGAAPIKLRSCTALAPKGLRRQPVRGRVRDGVNDEMRWIKDSRERAERRMGQKKPDLQHPRKKYNSNNNNAKDGGRDAKSEKRRRQKRHSQRGRVGRADADEDLLEGVYRVRPDQVIQELRRMAGSAQHADEILDKLPPDEVLEAVSIPIQLVGRLLEKVSYLARNALAIDRLAISRDDRIQVLVDKVRQETVNDAKQRSMPGVEGSVVSSSNADSSGDGSSSSDPAAVVQSSIQTLVALARLYKGVAPKESLHVESFSEIADFLVRDTVQIPSARIGSIIWAVGVFKISKPQVANALIDRLISGQGQQGDDLELSPISISSALHSLAMMDCGDAADKLIAALGEEWGRDGDDSAHGRTEDDVDEDRVARGGKRVMYSALLSFDTNHLAQSCWALAVMRKFDTACFRMCWSAIARFGLDRGMGWTPAEYRQLKQVALALAIWLDAKHADGERASQYEHDLILNLLRMPLGPDDAILTRPDYGKKSSNSGAIQVVRSGVQRSVADCLRRIGRSFEEEVPFESLVSRQCMIGGGGSGTVKWNYTGIWPIDFVLSSPRGKRRSGIEEEENDDSSDSAEQCKFLAIEVEGPRHYFRNARRLVGPTNFKQIVIDEIPDVRVVQISVLEWSALNTFQDQCDWLRDKVQEFGF